MNKRTTLYCDTDTKADLQVFKVIPNQSDMLTLKLMMLYIGKDNINDFKIFSQTTLQEGFYDVKVDKQTNCVIAIKPGT